MRFLTKLICVLIFISISQMIYGRLKELREHVLTFKSNAKEALLHESMSGSVLRNFEPVAAIKSRKMYVPDTANTSKLLLMLFTAWDREKTSIELKRLIIRQWQTLPSAKLLLFTSSQQGVEQIRHTLWSSLPITRTFEECSNYPILPAMFLATMREKDVSFYGYANSNIVFGVGLKKTLDSIRMSKSWLTKPILIIGKSSQTSYSRQSSPVWKTLSPLQVSKLAISSQLTPKLNYFISNSLFPWNLVPEMTVGFPLAAEILVSWALQRDVQVIDATNTIQVLSVSPSKKISANTNKTCNERMIPLILKNSSVVLKGQANCAILETHGTTLTQAHMPSVHIRSRKPHVKC